MEQEQKRLTAGEALIRQLIDQGKFRKARDEAKVLIKIDRARFLPLLIAANSGLAQEMLSRGMVNEAMQVVAYLRTIARTDQIVAVELALAQKQNKVSPQVGEALKVLSQTAATLSPAQRQQRVDILVTAFQPSGSNQPSQEGLAGQIQIIQESLQLVCESQFAAASDRLRPLPNGSEVDAWKRYIKGLIAYHTGDKERAQRFFKELPEQSVVHTAAQPYLVLLGESRPGPEQANTEVILEGLFSLVGVKAPAHALLRADQEWKAGRHNEAFRYFASNWPDFPKASTDLSGALTDFFFNAIFTLPKEEIESYGTTLGKAASPKNRPKPLMQELALRMYSLLSARENDPQLFFECFDNHLEFYKNHHPANPKMISWAYQALAAGMAGNLPSPSLLQGLSPWELQSLEERVDYVEQAFEISLRSDPNNVEAQLEYCHFLERMQKNKERYKFVDAMAARFPEHKKVILEAGRAALERAVYTKADNLLTQVYALDKIDPTIPELLLKARLKIIQGKYQKLKPVQQEQIENSTEELIQETSDSYYRARWCHLTRLGCLELFYGQKPLATALLAQARERSPSRAQFLLFAQCQVKHLKSIPNRENIFWPDLLVQSRGKVSLEECLALARIYSFWRKEDRLIALEEESQALLDFIKKALKGEIPRLPAVALFDYLLEENILTKQLLPLAQIALKAHPKDPFFRLVIVALEQLKNPSFQISVQTLQDIQKDATRQGDKPTAAKAAELLSAVTEARNLPFSPDEMAEMFDEDKEEDEDFLPDQAPSGFAEMLELLELKKSDPKRFQQFLKSIPSRTKREEFLVLIDLVEKVKKKADAEAEIEDSDRF